MNVNWVGLFQFLAFFLGWGAASESQHPIGAFFGTWFLAAAVFWYIGVLIRFDGKGGRSSGEGPGSNGASGGGGGG